MHQPMVHFGGAETSTHSSPSTVSRVFHTLEAEYDQWKSRPLCERSHKMGATYPNADRSFGARERAVAVMPTRLDLAPHHRSSVSPITTREVPALSLPSNAQSRV